MRRWSLRHSIIVALACGLLIAGSLSWQLRQVPPPPNLQHASLLQQPLPIANFLLLDHNLQGFDNQRLLGRWHLLSYGFTSCPDICPLTLAKLSKLQQELAALPQFKQLHLLFYSIDPARDSPEAMASYVDFFGSEITGIVAHPKWPERALPFEQGLGLQAKIEKATATTKDYSVSHGVLLYLLNPQGELQAVFNPIRQYNKVPEFDMQLVLQDYLTIRSYLAEHSLAQR